MLVRLLYASRAVDPSPEAIESILAQSRQHNSLTGITGILCYGGGIFLQAIEGGRMQVSELFGHIQRDARHKDVALLHYEEIFERRFGGDPRIVGQSILLDGESVTVIGVLPPSFDFEGTFSPGRPAGTPQQWREYRL